MNSFCCTTLNAARLKKSFVSVYSNVSFFRVLCCRGVIRAEYKCRTEQRGVFVCIYKFAYKNNSCIYHTAFLLPLQGNHADHADEEIQMQNQQAGLGDVVPYICANVKPPSNQLHYATVNFQKDSVSVSTDGIALPDMNKNGSSACDYSSVSRTQGATHRPAPEQHLYSTVIVPEKP